MDRLTALRVFCAVVEHSSFSRAAVELNMSVAKVSKLVQGLEHSLNTSLLRRNTRRITVTEAGESYYQSMAPLLEEMANVDARVEQMTTSLSGTLRMTVPLDFGRRLIMPLIPEFKTTYPDLELDIELSDRHSDLVAEGFDLAVRIADLKDSSLIAKPLGRYAMLCAASPDYLARHEPIRTPADLEHHPCLTYSLISQPTVWPLSNGDEETKVLVRSALQLNNGDLLAQSASQHLGVLYQPDFILKPYLDAGQLVTVLPEWQQRRVNAWLVYPARKYLPMKVQAMVGFLEGRF
ncbi:LysR family transcriptional regulator [Saccharospirillum salsuginis]|uniref:LysR family transcriptional regulator n=1 Tax=Saccharospirillum salsuginis TaxID=418750 RepID=A0A918N8P3_9GAMM|nr:LysR family transcriptional regulator [Saccharospirillum salsuginis]GGX47802.1 LysR family transcriptional regulator [Saccharospirillum salsuginis]